MREIKGLMNGLKKLELKKTANFQKEKQIIAAWEGRE